MGELLDGKYEVIEKLREGGMGAIFKVRHVLLDEIRVVKTMKSGTEDDERSRKRFYGEARLATSLRHPGIVTVHDFFEEKDGAFGIVMEYIDGPNLTDRGMGPEKIGVPEVLEIAVQTLDALGYLHRSGIVHRDVSPENVMLQRQSDGSIRAKLIDLGVAKETEGEGLTRTGMFVGKIRYSSPEQLGALPKDGRIDGRSDIYSFGCVLYQLLTGQLPVRADTMQGYIIGHVTLPPRPFKDTDPASRIPPALREAVLKAIAKKRDDRWSSADEFARALRGILEQYRSGALADAATEPPAEAAAWDAPTLVGSGQPAAGAYPAGVQPLPDAQSAVTSASPPLLPHPGSGPRPVRPVTSAATAPPATLAGGRRGSKTGLALGLVAAAVVVLGAGTALLFRLGVIRLGAPPSPGSLVVTSAPAARIVKVVDGQGKEPVPTAALGEAPARLALPPGSYTVSLRGSLDGGKEVETTVQATVTAGQETRVHATLPGFDVEALVSSYAP